ncbi:unnamed protein product [Cyprideis torosa]|uniref:Uncharacterized protein n=1 Tax=Cyprideis torosa TaxID=163714 RepID=A0A7R8W7W9_9CRUS|nr:unnamed protein product [Cyprideis torosa]CAG0888007.1 unnamed protein product [Cyprideis torosa]
MCIFRITPTPSRGGDESPSPLHPLAERREPPDEVRGFSVDSKGRASGTGREEGCPVSSHPVSSHPIRKLLGGVVFLTIKHPARSYSVSVKQALLNVPETRVSTLNNGIRVATEDSGIPTATIGLWIDTGSRYETGENNGVAHFLEHMAFKGTEKRSQTQLELEVENMGAHLNAYTSREQTVFYAKCLSKDIPQALDILADIIQNSKFGPQEIDRERGVILREMQEVDTNMQEVVFDHMHSIAYQGTPLAQTILGPTKNIIWAGSLHTGTEPSLKLPLVGTQTSGVRALSSPFRCRIRVDYGARRESELRHPFVFAGSEVRVRNDDMPLAYVAIAIEGCGWDNPDNLALMVASSMIGSWDRSHGGGNHLASKLAAYCHEYGHAHSFQAFNTCYRDTGLWGVYYVADRMKLYHMHWNVQEEWMRICNSATPFEVERGKALLRNNMLLQLDGSTPVAEDIGRQMLTYGRRIPPHEMDARIQAITAQDVRDVCMKYLYDRCPVVVGVGPIEGLPDYTWSRAGMYWLRIVSQRCGPKMSKTGSSTVSGDILTGHQAVSTYHETDINSALVELEKGLRTSVEGEQCESILNCIQLFEKYPFPLLINTAFLRLADVYPRALTLRVLGSLASVIHERKQVHHCVRVGLDSHDKVELEAAIMACKQLARYSRTFANNICDKISTMMESLAHPIEVKLLLLPIFEHMHHDTDTAHRVRELCKAQLKQNANPSRDIVTLTLRTLTKLAASTIVDIPEHVGFLLQYLLQDPTRSIRVCALNDLCYLARQGPHLWREEHVRVLVKFAKSQDIDELFMCLSLSALKHLSSSAAVLNSVADQGVLGLCLSATDNPSHYVAARATSLLTSIVVHCKQESVAIPEQMCLTGRAHVALKMLLCVLIEDEDAASSDSPESPPPTQQAPDSSQQSPSRRFRSLSSHEERPTLDANEKALRIALHSTVALAEVDEDVCKEMLEFLSSLLLRARGPQCLLTADALCAMASTHAGSSLIVLGSVLDLMRKLGTDQVEEGEVQEVDEGLKQETLVRLYTLFFQSLKGRGQLPREAKDTFASTQGTLTPWSLYKMARQGLRYGYYSLCAPLWLTLSENVSLGKHYHWLRGLHFFSLSEGNLQLDSEAPKPLHLRLQTALKHAGLCLSSLRAASNADYPHAFQIHFCRIRCLALRAFAILLQACGSLCTAPPPSSAGGASTGGSSVREDIARCGRVVTQLTRSVKDLSECSQEHRNLYQSAFDSDPLSLVILVLLEQQLALLVDGIEAVVLRGAVGSSTVTLDAPSTGGPIQLKLVKRFISETHEQSFQKTLETRPLFDVCLESMNQLNQLAVANQESGINRVSGADVSCLREIVQRFLQTPVPVPRFFFQTLQQTEVKLSVTPTPPPLASGSENAIFHQTSQGLLAVKVEGVIQRGDGTEAGKTNRKESHQKVSYREVCEVCLEVETHLLQAAPRPKGSVPPPPVKSPEGPTKISRRVVPHKDFFSAHFLLSFPQAGLHQLLVTAKIIDEDHQPWTSGPKFAVNIRVSDDSNKVTTPVI